MNIVMVSNYFNHHQQPLAEALFRICDGQFRFIATTTMGQERKDLGYGTGETPAYVLQSWTDGETCRRMIDEADVVIAGSAPEAMLRSRIGAGKLLFRYSERPLKNGPEWAKFIPRLIRWHLRNPAGKPVYMLCAGGYTAGDYQKFGLFRKRMYRWGYFPEVREYRKLPAKEPNTILWCGRFLDWKHPGDALCAAKKLHDQGYAFTLTFVGAGEMEAHLRVLTGQMGMENCVRFPGAVKPAEVRQYMERSAVCLLTSGREEGWGAVLNEAMSSGCAVVAGHAAGSVPFLVRDGENGLIYESGNVDMLCERIRFLLDHPGEQTRLGAAAYRTMAEVWNAEAAAQRLVCLSRRILAGEKHPAIYEDGPCSRAEIIREDWCNR